MDRDLTKYAIIVAGGKGVRMGGETPKQFLPLGGKPVLMRTMERFVDAEPTVRIFLVLPEDQMEAWQRLCVRHKFHIQHTVVEGGATRFHSVKNGVRAIEEINKLQPSERAIVAIHDGVRPFVSADVIRRCFDVADLTGSAVPVIPVHETLRQIKQKSDGADANYSKTVDRNRYRLVQTPQTFRLSLLSEAFQQLYEKKFTDDAAVVEAIGEDVSLIEGNRENIKLTTPFDLLVAEALLQNDC